MCKKCFSLNFTVHLKAVLERTIKKYQEIVSVFISVVIQDSYVIVCLNIISIQHVGDVSY